MAGPGHRNRALSSEGPGTFFTFTYDQTRPIQVMYSTMRFARLDRTGSIQPHCIMH